MEFKDIDGKADITISASYQQSLWRNSNALKTLVFKSLFGPRSHVLLTACGPGENAYEDHERREGRFTAALLRTLRGKVTSNMTYYELMMRLEDLPGCVTLPIPHATPI